MQTREQKVKEREDHLLKFQDKLSCIHPFSNLAIFMLPHKGISGRDAIFIAYVLTDVREFHITLTKVDIYKSPSGDALSSKQSGNPFDFHKFPDAQEIIHFFADWGD